MRTLALLVLAWAAVGQPHAFADDAAALAVLRADCATDAQKFCSSVPSGGGRILACLKEHRDEVSDACKQAAAKAAALGGNAAPHTAPSTSSGFSSDSAPSSDSVPGPPASSALPAKPPSRSTAKASDGAPGSYLRLKRVQVTDPGAANVYAAMPAIDLLIPSAWQFKGTVSFGGGKGGCFSDLMAVSWEATSPDGSLAFQGAPNYSWQYTNDPTELKKLTDPNRRQLGAGGKPCPLAQPMKAEDYFRQTVVPALPSDSTVIKIEAFPELNQMVRQQLGLPSADSGNGPVRTEAIRARVESQKDGKAVESWVTLALTTHAFQVGRGLFWDCHAIDVMALRAPKGKLDANDKLFKVMVSSVRPEPKWQATSNSIIAKFYEAEAQKEAQQDQMIADFQRKVIQTINETTANAQRGSQKSAFGESQIIRGVQTFRDPATGNTMELSSQYDHAWLNGSNEYVMSDDPNFNPNSQLSGSWNQLQVVHPSP
jgi:hypothetical protein